MKKVMTNYAKHNKKIKGNNTMFYVKTQIVKKITESQKKFTK